MDVVTAQQMQELDKKTIEQIGIPGSVLMENAGRGTFEKMLQHFPDIQQRTVTVLAGRGNNGGDGFVIARYLLNNHISVKAFLLASKNSVSGDAASNLHAYERMGGSIQEVPDERSWKSVLPEITRADLIVDALLGTGLSTDVTGLLYRVIEDVNQMRVPVMAVDLPSGIDATTGRVLGIAIKAHITCTFGLAKRGLIIYPGLSYVGKLEIIDIGIPRSLVVNAGFKEHLLEEGDFCSKIPPRDPDSHKGTYGHVLVLAGSPGKTGAAAMVGESAMRAGAGLVTLGVPARLNQILEVKVTEVMTEPLPDADSGFLCMESWQRIQEVLPDKTVIAIGPGISDREETAKLVYKVLQQARVPMVIDADGLNVISRNAGVLKKATAPIVVTPHPGEMARLMGITTQAVQADRIGNAQRFAAEYGVTVVLKGVRTVIAEPGGHVYINPTGNPGMASGGMGDVLTGMIAGLIAQGRYPLFAARFSVFLHGSIGDLIASRRGQVGIIATDIIKRIPGALQHFL